VLLAYCIIKKRRQRATTTSHSNPTYAFSEPKPTTGTVTTSHANPTYDASDYKPGNQKKEHEYFMAPPEWSKSESDLAEQWYDDIANKDLKEGFADEPIYDCLEPSQKGNHYLSFTNQSFPSSSDT